MEAHEVAYPDWTEYRKKNGLDPLGMQNSSISLYQRLLPGISNVTLRVRYYGLYAWLAALYAERSGDTNPKTWQRFVRRAEALYALAAQRRGGEGGIAGIQWAQRTLDANPAGPLRFAPDADPGGEGNPYLQQAWGAYGAAYASQLFEMGVFAIAKGHEIPVPSPEIGEALSEAFAESAGELAERFYASIESGMVSIADLDAFAALTPSAIAYGSAERQLYQSMLFAEGSLRRPADISRRETLLLLLKAAAQLERLPDVTTVRWLLYAGADRDDKALVISTAALQEQQRRWWIYQANDLLHFSYETLLKFGLDILGSYPAGITLNTLIGEIVSSISEAAPSWPATWGGFLADETPAKNAYASSVPHAERNLINLIWAGIGSSKKTTSEGAWAALKLIAIIENRTREVRAAVQAEFGHLDNQGFHSLITEMEFLASQEVEDFSRVVARIVEERIIKRHLWVAHRKFRYQGDYTFLIEADDGRVRQRADSGPVFTNPRLGPALTFLKDAHLIDDGGLTAQGKVLLGAL